MIEVNCLKTKQLIEKASLNFSSVRYIKVSSLKLDEGMENTLSAFIPDS